VTPAKLKPSEVSPKIKEAIRHLLTQEQFDFAKAARVAGVSTERLRDDLQRPHVRKYLREQRRAQIEAVCAANPIVLAAIRDHGKNEMARVQAIRTSEALRESAIEEDRGASARAISPGLVIQIGGAARIEVQQPQRLGAARTIHEPGAIDREVLDADIVADDEPGGG
jgi:hypothetical protein